MAIGTVTLAWQVVDPFTFAPGVGRVRVRVPLPLRATTEHLLIGNEQPSSWIPLDVDGKGAITIPDPHDPGVSPQGWSPAVEFDTDVLSEKYAVVIPPGSAGTTIHLDTKAPVQPVPPVVDYALVSSLEDLRDYVDEQLGDGGPAPDATTGSKGVVQLAGDLGGTAAAPTVPALAAKYSKPGPGIPAADLAAAVQTSLGKADTAVQPGGLALVATTGSAADLTGVLPASALPDIAVTDYLGPAANQATMLALGGQKGDWCTRTDLGTTWLITGANPALIASWTALSYPASPVVSVFGRTGAVTATKADVGLGSVDNTTDLGKPISTATQAALDTKARRLTVVSARITSGNVDPLPNTSGAWLPLAGFEIAIPAAVGDWLKLGVRAMRTEGSPGAYLDFGVLVGSTIARFLSSDTSSPSVEGDPAWYFAAGYLLQTAPVPLRVEAGDLDGGNVRFAIVTKSAASGRLYASASYPFRWYVENHGNAA